MMSKTLLAVMLTLSFATAFAQSEEQVLNSDPIDVDGYLHEKQVTDGELEQIKSEIRKQKNEVQLNKEKSKGFKELSKTTEKLSDTTEEYIGDKKDAQKEIAEYNKKIKCLMEENPGKDCEKYVKNRNVEPEVQEVAVVQAAPAPVEAAVSETVVDGTPDLNKPMEEIKFAILAGATNYSGEQEQLQTEMSAGMRLESNVSPRMSVGFGFNYASLKTEDFANSAFSTLPQYGNYYGNYGAQGREIQFKTMGIDLYGKFFITRGERFRPYLGAGLGFNQANLRYTQNSPYQNQYQGQNYTYGDEAYKASYMSGRLMGGTEVMISQAFGLNIEANYSTGFGDGFGKSDAKNPTSSPDQARLKALGKDIINANALSIFAGAVIVF